MTDWLCIAAYSAEIKPITKLLPLFIRYLCCQPFRMAPIAAHAAINKQAIDAAPSIGVAKTSPSGIDAVNQNEATVKPKNCDVNCNPARVTSGMILLVREQRAIAKAGVPSVTKSAKARKASLEM